MSRVLSGYRSTRRWPLAAILALLTLLATSLPAQAVTSVWTPLQNSDSSNYQRFGWSVALSADGSTQITGNPSLVDASGTQVIGGAAYIYSGISTANNPTRTEDAGGLLKANDAPYESASDKFGTSVALSSDGQIAVVGAPQYGGGSGAVYVFTHALGVWSRTAKIAAPPSLATAFGTSVALAGSGTSTRLLVGAPGAASNTGGAAFYEVNAAGTWVLKNQFVGTAFSQMGQAVAISEDGIRAVVSQPAYRPTSTTLRGRINTYVWSGTAWQLQNYVDDPQPAGSTSTTPRFGWSVALSASGNALLVGSPRRALIGTQYVSGIAYLYGQSGTAWASTRSFSFNVTASGTGADFGNAVALSSDGKTVTIGAPSAGASGAGTAGGQVFQWRFGTTWSASPTMLPPGPTGTSDRFGYSVDTAGNSRVTVGAILSNRYAAQAGAAWVIDQS